MSMAPVETPGCAAFLLSPRPRVKSDDYPRIGTRATVSGIDGRVHLGTTASPPELIGRASECRALDELLDGVRGGHSRVLVVRGDAGMGKSALLQQVVTSAKDFRVEIATGVESDMELPFAALHQLCAPMLDRLDALPEPQRDAMHGAFGLHPPRPADRLLIGLAVLNLLSVVSDEGPLLCVVDDAQWLDRASLQVLAFVTRRLLAERVGLAFATRSELSELDGFPELAVEALRDGDAKTLLSTVLHVPLDERVRDRIVSETYGNPLAIVEWPRGMKPADFAGGFAMPASLPMVDRIEERFRRRLAALPEPTTRFLTVAAADPVGDPVIVWSAASALGVEASDATPAIDAGLVEIGVRVWFRHPLVRSAAYGSVGLAERQAAHRALAEAIDPDLDPDRRAWHRALGSPGPDEEIAAELERSAGRAQARGGIAAAAALLERSAALTLDRKQRVARLLAAAPAYLEAGSYDAAAGLLAAAETLADDDATRAFIDSLKGFHAMFSGDLEDSRLLFLRAAKGLQPIDIDSATLAYVRAIRAAEFLSDDGDGVGSREACEAALACPLPPVRTTEHWILIGDAQWTLYGAAVAVPALRRGLGPLSEGLSAADAIEWQAHQLGVATRLWDIETLRDIAVEQVAAARELGSLTILPLGLNGLAFAQVILGDLDAADGALTEATQIGTATGSSMLFTTAAAFRAAMVGADDAAALIDSQLEASHDARLALGIATALWSKAILYNGKGQYELAVTNALEADQVPWPIAGSLFYAELIEAAVRTGKADLAAATVVRLRERTEACGTDWAIGVERRSAALLDDPRAEELYLESIERLGRTPVRPELARAHLLYGEWLRREKRRVDARDQLRTAHDMFVAMGMRAFSERARRELLVTGETVRKRSPDTFNELTPQEAHIARLAAEGYTNVEIGGQLFISARTVEWHMSKILSKLGVKSRRGLRNALPQQSGVAEPG